MNSKLTLVSEKSAQQRLLTLLAVKAAMAQENNSEEEQECLMILARAMEFFSFTTKDLDPYVEACCGLLFNNELCYEERREMLEHNCGLNKFEELFAQFEYLYMQKTVPKEHLQFLLQSYRNLKKGKLAKWQEKKLREMETLKYLPTRWFHGVLFTDEN